MFKIGKPVSRAIFSIVAAMGLGSAAAAHTISIGYVPGLNPGEVTFWVGNYTHSGTPGNVPNEGSIQLVGVDGTSYGPVTELFDLNTLSKPTGLTDGSNYFYVSGPLGGTGPLVDSIAPFLTVCSACGPVTAWQGKTLTGLNPGTYQFSFIEQLIPTQDWTEWNGSLNSTLTLTGSDIGGGGTDGLVPLPAGLPMLLGALGVFAFLRRRQT